MSKTRLNGKVIEDATEPLTFQVTAKDLKDAKERDPMTCALARGLTNHGVALSTRIGTKIAIVEFKDRVLRYSIADGDRRKIDAFDLAHYFQPGNYTLYPPKAKALLERRRNYQKEYAKRQPRGSRGTAVHRRKSIRHAMRVKGQENSVITRS